MKLPAIPIPYLVAGGAVLAALVWINVKGARAAGESLGGAVVDMTDGVITGAVTGIGDGLGVPRTNMTECERAKAEGRTWDASFACPAADFLKYVFN